MQNRGTLTPMRPLNPGGRVPDIQPAPAPEGEEQQGRLERQPPRSQRDRGIRRPGTPAQPPEGSQPPPPSPEGG